MYDIATIEYKEYIYLTFGDFMDDNSETQIAAKDILAAPVGTVWQAGMHDEWKSDWFRERAELVFKDEEERLFVLVVYGDYKDRDGQMAGSVKTITIYKPCS